ncbi:hypothetical protein L3Q82_018182, partial [Scortum barcoo]
MNGKKFSVVSATLGKMSATYCFLMDITQLICCICFAEHKVIIVGLDNAGKTTILYQFLMNEVVHTSAHNRKQRGRNSGQEHPLPDVGHRRAGVSAVLLEHLLLQHRGEKCKQHYGSTFCTLGAEVLSGSRFFSPSVAAGVFVQSTRRQQGPPKSRGQVLTKGARLKSEARFIILVVDSTDRERLVISKEELYRMLAHEDLRKAAVLIFANKQDMKDCMSAAEISKYLTLSSIKDHPWHIQSCCALTGE